MISRSTSEGVVSEPRADTAYLPPEAAAWAPPGAMPSRGFDERVLGALREIPPGLALACAIALAAHLIAKLAFPYALAIGFEVPLAMLIGLVLANVGVAGGRTLRGSKVAVRYVLGFGIILLGLRLNLHSVAGIGSEAVGLVVMAMALACGFAVLVARRLRTERRVAILIGIGSSVCGASAIAATAPVVRANQREMSFAIATVTLFGTLAVFVFPLVGHALDLDVLTFGLWAGAAVGDTAQTIATSAAYDTVGRDVAVVVKLLRTVLLAPLLLLIAWSWSRSEDRSLVSAHATRRGIRNALPFFVVGFVALAAVRTLGYVDAETVADIDPLTRGCFLVALAGLGLQTRLGDIRAAGLRPFLLALATWALLASATLAAILAFGLGPARTEVAGSVDPRPLGIWTPVCTDGAEPAFAGAFVGLADRLSDEIGRPLGCAEFDEGDATTVQRTSEGVATFEQTTGRVTFANGERTWTLRGPAVAAGPASAGSADEGGATRLTGRMLATGIPGAGALSPVGRFHPGGPMHDQGDFAATTEPGEILDPKRLLVASTSNFGAPAARADWEPGSILSLATDDGSPLQVPSRFAASGDQASAADGATRLYTAQSPEFLNRVPHSEADTADMPAVSNPLGISVNNAFGRPWFANAPGSRYAFTGAESVLDPDGRPLSEAPSERAGGIFAGSITNRDGQREPGGLEFGAVGNAFLGASPDASGRAVFAVATADGALAQVHVEDGVDGLAPPGTIAPLDPGGGAAPWRSPRRVGMVFNWVPDRFLYVADPGNDAVLQLHLDDDYRVFEVAETRRLESSYLSAPVDLAPAVAEVANPAFSSNTTLAGGADLYVANRGSGTIVRLRQDGQVRAVAEIRLPGHGAIGPDLISGIAVSPDAQTLWVSLSAGAAADSRLSGSVIEVPAFGAPG